MEKRCSCDSMDVVMTVWHGLFLMALFALFHFLVRGRLREGIINFWGLCMLLIGNARGVLEGRAGRGRLGGPGRCRV